MSNKKHLKLGMTVSYRNSKGKVYVGSLISLDTMVQNDKEYVLISTREGEQLHIPLSRCKLLLNNNQFVSKEEDYYKLYIIIRSDVPDNMAPVLVAHSMLNADNHFKDDEVYKEWKEKSFRKVVVRTKDYSEYERLVGMFPQAFEGKENITCNGEPTCLIPVPVLNSKVPGALKGLSSWKPIK